MYRVNGEECETLAEAVERYREARCNDEAHIEHIDGSPLTDAEINAAGGQLIGALLRRSRTRRLTQKVITHLQGKVSA